MKNALLRFIDNCILSTFYLFSIGSIQGIIEHLTPSQIKFILMGTAVPFVAIYMLHKDNVNKTPTKSDVFFTFLISIIFIWFGYELFTYFNMPVFLGLLISFFFGISSLPIAMKGKEIFIDSFGNLLKKFLEKLGKKINDLF